MRSLALRKGEGINDMRNTGVTASATPVSAMIHGLADTVFRLFFFFCFQSTENGFGFAKEKFVESAAALISRNK